MPIKHHDWSDGPAQLESHSVAKHKVIETYLTEYFKTLTCTPSQDEFRLTLVDGFSGGGIYTHKDTNAEVLGSPFILLNAVKEAEVYLNLGRKKTLNLDVSYFFVDKNISAIQSLEKELKGRGYGSIVEKSAKLVCSTFQNTAKDIIDFIKTKSPRNGRSIFVLDQYGYKDVPIPLMRKIFSSLPSAEVILTFGVNSFINYASDSDKSNKALGNLGMPDIFQEKTIEEIKSSEKDWRLFIQSYMYDALVKSCGARYYTPFFIRNTCGHGDYWLLHLSQHYRARDVMTKVHWKNNNHFSNYSPPIESISPASAI